MFMCVCVVYVLFDAVGDYKPEYSIIELAVEMSLEPSSNTRPRFMKPGGNDPGPDGDGKCRFECPMPGDGARRGGVARPKPESVSACIHKAAAAGETYIYRYSRIWRGEMRSIQ